MIENRIFEATDAPVGISWDERVAVDRLAYLLDHMTDIVRVQKEISLGPRDRADLFAWMTDGCVIVAECKLVLRKQAITQLLRYHRIASAIWDETTVYPMLYGFEVGSNLPSAETIQREFGITVWLDPAAGVRPPKQRRGW